MNIKKIILVSLLVLMVLCFALPVLAQSAPTSVLQPKGTASGPLESVIANIINAATYIAGSIAVLFLIISGLQLITSSGNAERIQAAKSTIIYIIIGLIVIILSSVIVQFVITKLAK